MVTQTKIILFFLYLFASLNLIAQSVGIEKCIDNIDTYEDFNDYKFIDKFVKEKNVIFLGGGMHSVKQEGAERFKLIKYLQQQHGFDVILIERSFCDLYRLNISFENGMNLSDSTSKYIDAALDDYEYEVVKYVYECREKNNNVILGGLDIAKPHYSIYNNPFQFFDNYTYFGGNHEIQFLKNNFNDYSINSELILSSLNSLFAYIIKFSETNPNEGDLLLQVYKNIEALFQYNRQIPYVPFKKQDGSYHRYRDSIMADNFNYFKKKYSNSKIIVLTTTFHITKDISDFSKLSPSLFGKSSKPMGQYISDNMENNIYSIITIVNRGDSKDKRPLKLPKRSSKSLEAVIRRKRVSKMFVDLHELNKAGCSSFYMYPFFSRKKNFAKWYEIYDAVIYIDKVQRSDIYQPNLNLKGWL